MVDAGYDETEKILNALEVRISKEYKKASEEAQAKLDDYLRRFEIKDELKKKALDNNFITKHDYTEWRKSQIMVGERWEELRDNLAKDYHNANAIAKSTIKGYMPEVYAINHNFGTYQVEKDAGIDTAYTLYNTKAVERLMRDNPQLLPDPGKKVSRRIANGLDVRWNRQQIQSVMMQAILLGDSIPEIAHKLAMTVGDKNHKAAIRNARTMTTGAQNAGRLDSFKRAEEMGVVLKQQWLAVHDGRTRHSHRAIDYEIQEVDHEFSNGCRYPGDPFGPAREVYNCRCTLRAVVDGLEPRARKYQDPLIEGMTYDEWKNAKARSNPIDLPEKKGEAIKQAYNAEYRKYAKLPKTESSADYMGQPRNFDYKVRIEKYHLPGAEIKTKTIHVKGYKMDEHKNIYIQNYNNETKKTVEIISSLTNKISGLEQVDDIIVTTRISGIASYNHETNVLYVNSMLGDEKWSKKCLTDFFVADTFEDTIKHEMYHKKHWDKVYELAQTKEIKDVIMIKQKMESKLRGYVSRQVSLEPYYLKNNVSGNAYEGFKFDNSLNEAVAEVLLQAEKGKTKDALLLNHVKEMFL